MKVGVSGKFGRTAGLWLAAVLLLLIMAAPALSTIFAAPGSVNTKAIRKGAVTSAKIKNKTIKNADIAAGAAIAASKINTAAYVLTAADFAYAVPKTGRIAIPGGAFLPENEWYNYFRYGPDIYAESTGTFYETYQAPVYLPDGAQITSFSYTFRDNSPTYTTDAKLWRTTYPSETNEPIASITTLGLPNDFAWRTSTTTAITNGLVDNANYVYYIKIKLVGAGGAGIAAARMTVEYTYDRPGS